MSKGMTRVEKLRVLYDEFNLVKEDHFQSSHMIILTRTGVEKIQSGMGIDVSFEVVRCEPDFCVLKAIAIKGDKRIESFGSAKHGKSAGMSGDGTVRMWYVMEMAEKRALARAVLKLADLYQHGFMSQDENDTDFKAPTASVRRGQKVNALQNEINSNENEISLVRAQEIYQEINGELELEPESYLGPVMNTLLDNFSVEELEGRSEDVLEYIGMKH
tara:strand:- start:3372 stop:4022 length:651 start_codon:yes stop_codon:yes gene_type:complete